MTAIDTAVIVADLRAAAPWVRRGWTTGTYHKDGKVCLTAAIVAGVRGRPPVTATGQWLPSLISSDQRTRCQAADDAVVGYLAERGLLDEMAALTYEPTAVTLVDWNDQQCRDGEHAAELLEAVAAELEAKRVSA
jgi:hypothetical protein